MRKAQISSQIFTYILAAVVIGIIVLVGYKAIGTVLDVISRAKIDGIKADFISSVSGTSKQYNKVERIEISLPDNFDRICLLDSLDKTTKEFTSDVKSSSELSDYPLIKLKVDADTDKNIFLLKNKKIVEEFYVENLNVEKNVLCVENSGINVFWLKGEGKTALLYQKTATN
jgi:hypothetical protein